MAEIQIDENVQLMQDVPELGLRRGELGLVCSTWFNPATAYEIEFQQTISHCLMRALLMGNQIAGVVGRY